MGILSSRSTTPRSANYENDTRDLLVYEQAHKLSGDKLPNAEECNSKQDIKELRYFETQE